MSPCKNLLQSSENSSFLVFEHQRSTKVEKRPDVWSSAILANLISYPTKYKLAKNICEKVWLSNNMTEDFSPKALVVVERLLEFLG